MEGAIAGKRARTRVPQTRVPTARKPYFQTLSVSLSFCPSALPHAHVRWAPRQTVPFYFQIGDYFCVFGLGLYCLPVLELEPGVSHRLDKCYVTEPHLKPAFPITLNSAEMVTYHQARGKPNYLSQISLLALSECSLPPPNPGMRQNLIGRTI